MDSFKYSYMEFLVKILFNIERNEDENFFIMLFHQTTKYGCLQFLDCVKNKHTRTQPNAHLNTYTNTYILKLYPTQQTEE